MIRAAVTVSLVKQAAGGPFVFWHDLPLACRTAADMGFDGIELFPPSADDLDATALRRMLEDHGLKLAAVGTGGGWVCQRLTLTSADGLLRSAAKRFIRSIIDFAALFGAPAIIGSMQGRASALIDRTTAIKHLRDALSELGEHANERGVPLLFEPLNRYETDIANTLQSATGVLDGVTNTNVRILADLFHMNIEEADMAGAIRSAGKHIGHVHFADSNRRPAGLGHTDFSAVVAALNEIQYDGYVSAECLPFPDSYSAAKQTMDSYRRFFRNA